MKIFLQLLCFICCLHSFVFAQNYNIPYRKGSLWGYADITGKITIEPKYDSVETSNENVRWLVFKNHYCGVIDKDGKEILATEYDEIGRCPVHSQYNQFYVVKNSKVGFTDIDGKCIISARYDMLQKCRDLPMDNDLYFFAAENGNKIINLIDKNEKVVLANITYVDNLYNDQYVFAVNNGKKGIYNVSKERWSVGPTFDSIKYLDYLDFYGRKEPYKNFKYYGMRKDTIFLIAKDMAVMAFPGKKLKDLFEPYSAEKYGSMSAEAVASVYEGDFVSVTGRQFTGEEYKTGEDNFSYNSKYNPVRSMVILKNEDGYQLRRFYLFPGYNATSKHTFDEIRLFKNGYNDKYGWKIALVRKNDQWGICSIPKDTMIAPCSYTSIDKHERYENILLLKNGNKTGLYEIVSGYSNDKFTPVAVPAEYDKFLYRNTVRSADFSYGSFQLYFFENNGKLCPVGINGTKFYEN